jgi:hypothetical protein
MVRSKRSVKKATIVADPTETSEAKPPVNDDVTGNLSEPDVCDKIDFQRLLAEKDNSYLELEAKFQLLTFKFNGERSKCKEFAKERVVFKTTCKALANQEVDRLNLSISSLKESAKSAEKSKKELLASKDVKFKETFTLYQKNIKVNLSLAAQGQVNLQKINQQITSISSLNGDLMAKIREVEALKKDNKTMKSTITALKKKKMDYDDKKMEYTLEMKRLANEGVQLKGQNTDTTSALREQTNIMVHKRKLAFAEFRVGQRLKAKEEDLARKEKAKISKMNAGSEQMVTLHGELRKQVASNGGTIPNPGTTPIGSVSSLSCLFVSQKYLTLVNTHTLLLTLQMVDQLMGKQIDMAKRYAAASLHQTTMTQQYPPVSEASVGDIPPGWQRMWDRPGGKEYFFNTATLEMTFDRARMFALSQEESIEESVQNFDEADGQAFAAYPDGVVSSHNTTTITPSPLANKRGGRNGSNHRLQTPTKPSSFGGFVEIQDSDDADDGGTVDYGPVKGRKKPRLANRPLNVLPQTMFASVPKKTAWGGDEGDSDSSVSASDFYSAVRTQDLPNTQDFGGAMALVDLQAEEGAYDEDEDEETDN